jgi:hypothetical protein
VDSFKEIEYLEFMKVFQVSLFSLVLFFSGMFQGSTLWSEKAFDGRFLLAGVNAHASSSDAEIRQKVGEAIRQRHSVPNREWWLSLGPEAPQVMISMHQETSHILHGMRILHGLAFFDDPVAIEYVKNEGRTTKRDVVRTAAIRAIADGQGDKELRYVEEFLGHDDADTRMVAGQVVREFADAGNLRAAELLDEFYEKEKTPWVAGRVRGEFPRSGGRPEAGTIQQERKRQVSDLFEGHWRGVWVEPEKEGGFKTQVAELHLKFNAEAELEGLLELKATKVGKVFSFLQSRGRGGQLSGRLKEQKESSQPSDSSSKTSETHGIEARLRKENEIDMVQLDIPGRAVTVILRKVPQGN